MNKDDFYLKEYERGLELLNQSERNLDRLAFLRLAFLLIAFLFLRNYLIDFREIEHGRSRLDSLGPTDKDATVFGFIAAHQKIENSVFVPDETAQTLINLIPKLSSFLGENLTLENQASRSVSEILLRATKKPERISIENQYLPKLSIPVSYSTLALFVYLMVLGSYFNFSFRRFRMGVLVLYLEHNLRRFRESVGLAMGDHPIVRSKRYIGRLCSARKASESLSAVLESEARNFSLRKNARRAFAYALETEGESPFRFLNAIASVCLFVAVGVVTVEIVAGEAGIRRGIILDAAYLCVLTFVPALLLGKLNAVVKQRFHLEREPFLPPTDEL